MNKSLFDVIHFIIYIVCFLISSFLCMKTINIFLIVKSKWKFKIVLYIGCSLLSNMIIYIGDLANLPPTILAFLITVLVSCEEITLKKVTITMMIASTAFAFNALYDNFLDMDYRSEARLVFWLVLYFIIRHHAPPKNYALSNALWKLLLLLTLTPLGIVLAIVLLQSPFYHTTGGARLSNFFLLVISIFSFIGLLWTVTVLARQQKLEQERSLVEMNQKYYENLEQHQYEVRKLKHDMANHLQILASLPEDQKKDYLLELINNPAINKTFHFCTNQTINAVLNAKSSLMEQNHITFQWDVQLAEPLSIANSDLCALLANALDNAIEACQKISGEKKFIHFIAKAQKGLFVIHITNPVKELIPLKQNKYHTTKNHPEEHGYGLRSIQEIVIRYGGNMEIEDKEHVFSLFLYLPINRKKKAHIL